MNGIWFDNTHSYDDLNLVLSTVNIPPATAKTNFVEIPGGDGSADLTEALGEVRYKDRECTFTFAVFPYDDFEEKKREISNLLNGRRCKITLDKDPDYYWVGRCVINEYASDKNLHKVVVKATVAPYKLKTNQTTINVPAGQNVTASLWNSRRTIVPNIISTADATIVFNGNRYDISAGTHKILNIELVEGVNIVTVTSTKPVTFIYQEGDL
jgi:phage-related protein